MIKKLIIESKEMRLRYKLGFCCKFASDEHLINGKLRSLMRCFRWNYKQRLKS